MSQSKDVDSFVHIYLFSDVRRYIPGELLYRREFFGFRGEDLREAERRVGSRVAEDFLRRRVCLYSGLNHFFALSDREPLRTEDALMYGVHGKPCLSRKNLEHFDFFNLSARGDTILLAVSHHREVGADLEDLRQKLHDSSMDAVMGFYFNEREQSYVSSGDKKRRFLELWTRKEAAVKACGLSIASHGLSVDALGIPWIACRGEKISGCSFSLPGLEQFVASVAIPGGIDASRLKFVDGNQIIRGF